MSNLNLKRKLDSTNETTSVPSRSQVLNDKLSRRPDRHLLVEQGILHDSQCAPSLQHVEHALKRARLVDELNNRLSNRPGPLDLIQHNILHIDTKEHPNLEQAIQGGQIPFKPTSTYNRPLIFHEYTGSPLSSKPKVTKVDSLSLSSNVHHIRLAQQQLLLELTSNKLEEQQSSSVLLSHKKTLEQMTLVELRDLCKQYQIPSSHANKTKLIQRIKQAQNKVINQDSQISNTNLNELSNVDIIASLDMSDINDEEVEPLSTSELDEILKYFPLNLTNPENDQSTLNQSIDFDFQNSINDCQTINNDDLFVQMLLDNDYSSIVSSSTTTDDFILTDILPSSLPLSTSLCSSIPRITSVDEFDAFLRDFTLNISSHQSEVSTAIS